MMHKNNYETVSESEFRSQRNELSVNSAAESVSAQERSLLYPFS